MTILRNEVQAITDRQGFYQDAEDYYEGRVGERFSSNLMRRVFAHKGYSARLNFCRPVVDAVFNRLEIASVVGVDETAQKIIGDTWEFNELDLDADEIHRRALSFGDCYVMVWPDEDGNMEISYNTPLTTTLVYDPERPKKKAYAVKMWETNDGTRLNIYKAEAIEKYFVKSKSPTEGTQWNLIETVDNPFGEIPVFHFRTERPFGRPEHLDAYEAQDYINKQFLTSMHVTDYQGAPQRYALLKENQSSEAEDFAEGDTQRENSRALQNGPGEVWFMGGVDKVGQFDAADPDVFWSPIKDTVRAMASLTNTPLHYFEKTGNVPSGEALRVAEAPLIKKVDRRKQSFGNTWREIFKFVLKANEHEGDVQVKWKEIESLDALEILDAAMKKRTIGISLEQTLREMGYDDEVITLVMAEAAVNREEGQVTRYPNGGEKTNDQSNATEIGDN